MAKTFYTEHDIEDMVKRGTLTLEITDDIVLTDLAYEKAAKLGLKMMRPDQKPPSAPVRPYITKKTSSRPVSSRGDPPADTSLSTSKDLRQRVRDAVIARLGGEVDIKLLDTIIQRVLDNVGVK